MFFLILTMTQLELEVYQFVCESDVIKMQPKRTTCTRQTIVDWISEVGFQPGCAITALPLLFSFYQ